MAKRSKLYYRVPRAVRNNNPGNLRLTSTAWKGKIPGTDTEFVTFDTMLNGARAHLVNLRTLVRKYKATTYEKLIATYAPSFENDTAAYIKAVTTRLGVLPSAAVDLSPAALARLGYEMSVIEAGRVPQITQKLYVEAANLV